MEFRLGGLDYSCRPLKDHFPCTAEHLCIRKPRQMVENYATLVQQYRPRTIFELGIFQGGSTALLAQLAQPEKLVAVDIRTEPAEGLDEFIAAQGIQDSTAVHWGVDQSDRDRLKSILAEDIGERDLDMVIDDASHQLKETRASFDTLFPRLRPGGIFVLEDWSWAHTVMPVWPKRRPLTVLLFELVLASAYAEAIVASVDVHRAWATITRGPEEVDTDEFALADLVGERGHGLIAPVPQPPTPSRAKKLRHRLTAKGRR